MSPHRDRWLTLLGMQLLVVVALIQPKASGLLGLLAAVALWTLHLTRWREETGSDEPSL